MTSVHFDKRLRKILVRNGVLSEDDADAILADMAAEGGSLGDVVVRRGLVEELELVADIAVEMNIPPLNVARVTPGPEVLEFLPRDLAEYYGVLPVSKVDNILTVAVSNPFDVLMLDDVRIVTGCDIRPVVAGEAAIREAIPTAYGGDTSNLDELFEDMSDQDMELQSDERDEDVDLDAITGEDDGSPVIRMANLIIHQALAEGASDIHIEPMEKRLRVRCRKDGVLQEVMEPPRDMQAALISRFKIMASLDIAEHRRPQDGKFRMRIEGRSVDFRVSILPTVHGEKVVCRILDPDSLAVDLDSLGFEARALEQLREAVHSPWGMVLVTGPTGSGKSTTLYSCLKEVLSDTENVITVEDPVEYQLDGVNQVPVNPKTGLTFAAALRSILRQDPDIIMVGEIRDRETIEIAVKAALTGHMVLSTLHTNDAAATVSRMTDMGVDPFLVSSAVLLICAQRLCRRLCSTCRHPVELPAERLLEMGLRPVDLERETVRLHQAGPGCSRCNGGYDGRFAILETLQLDEAIGRVVMQGGSAADIKAAAVERGMITLRRAGLLKAVRGQTSLEEVLRVTLAD